MLIYEEGNAVPEMEAFDSEQAVQERVLTLVGTPVWVHIFYGWCGGITAPPFRYLMLPGKEPFPLFTPPSVPSESSDLLDGAYMGPWQDWDETEFDDSEGAGVDEPAEELAETEESGISDVLEPEDEFFFDDEDGGEETS